MKKLEQILIKFPECAHKTGFFSESELSNKKVKKYIYISLKN